MSTIETILSRAMNDAEFAELLFTDPDKAVAEYDLSAEEYAKLKSLSRTAFDSSAIEQRKSMGKFDGQIHIESFSWGQTQQG
jgi:hypothetical protein